MIAFRDETARRLGLDLHRAHQPGRRRGAGINPFDSGSTLHTQVMKTEALKQALDKYGFDAAFGGARRDEEKSRAKERIFSFRSAGHAWDPRNQRPELWKLYNTRIAPGRIDPRVPAVELDRARHLAIHPAREHPDRAALFRQAAAGRGARRHADHGRRRAACRCEPGETPEMRLVRFRTLGCYPLTGADRIRRRRRWRRSSPRCWRAHLRAAGPPDRQRRGRLDGEEEARGLFLMTASAAPVDAVGIGRAWPPTDAAALSDLRLASTTASRR